MNKALLNSSNSLYVEAHSALTVCVTSWRLLRSLWTEFTVMWDWRSCRERDDVRQQVQRDKDGVRIRVVDPPSVKRKWLCVTPAIPVHTGAFFFHSRWSLWCFCLDALHLREVVRYWTLNHVISPTLLVKAFRLPHTQKMWQKFTNRRPHTHTQTHLNSRSVPVYCSTDWAQLETLCDVTEDVEG